MMRALSLCSGIGGLDLAAEWAGIEVVGQVEIDAYCRAVLARHWPAVARYADIREVTGDECGAVDLVFGGIPCQPWSGAGKRRGADDDRDLWPETRRVIAACRPAWVCIENVSRFARVALDRVFAELAADGYEVGALMVPAAAAGAPHLRERIFVLAHARRDESQRGRNVGELSSSPTAEQGAASQRQRYGHAAGHGGAHVGVGHADPHGGQRTGRRDAATGRDDVRRARAAWDESGGCGQDLANAEREQGGQRHELTGVRGRSCPTQLVGLGDIGDDVADAPHGGIRRGRAPRQTGQPARGGEAGGMEPGAELEYADGAGRGKRVVPAQSGRARQRHRQSPGVGDTDRQPEPGLRGDADGLSGGLDRCPVHAWPVGPHEPQHVWEPPRTTTERIPNRAARLKALGNAVVPQQAFPIFAAIVAAAREEVTA